eukprot:TRINITY_DN12821_c0_g2_i1.p1 TRINITY_DN12821_c0_g2~~TRINITY_DN12821_c0_g2_i1.p1  ORF type:complete len:217 (-),score=1.45 TRINITY_DN12821_c0_g2_i1:237-887(-)
MTSAGILHILLLLAVACQYMDGAAGAAIVNTTSWIYRSGTCLGNCPNIVFEFHSDGLCTFDTFGYADPNEWYYEPRSQHSSQFSAANFRRVISMVASVPFFETFNIQYSGGLDVSSVQIVLTSNGVSKSVTVAGESPDGWKRLRDASWLLAELCGLKKCPGACSANTRLSSGPWLSGRALQLLSSGVVVLFLGAVYWSLFCVQKSGAKLESSLVLA